MGSYRKYFPAWERYILAGYWAGKFCRRPIFNLGDTSFKKNGSILLYLNILRPVTFIFCFVGVLHRFKNNKNLYHITFTIIAQVKRIIVSDS